jgi:hypothetical protein
MGIFAIPATLILAVVYLILIVLLFKQFYLLIKERFKSKHRLFKTILLTIVLTLTYFKPWGIIDFEKWEGGDILIAEREGSANCLTTLRLKDNYTFRERIGCFGISEIKGTFRVVNDTIYFDNIQLGRHEESFYKFAVIKPSQFDNPKILGDLIRYKDLTDTTGHFLWITKNDLSKLKYKMPNR